MRTIPDSARIPRTIQIRRERHNSLCDALNKVLDTGVVALGEVKLSVADVDLVYVGLQLVITSIQSSDDKFAPGSSWANQASADNIIDDNSRLLNPMDVIPADTAARALNVSPSAISAVSASLPSSAATSILPSPAGDGTTASGKEKNGLGQLVLTVIKLLHELMKKQALRRMEGESLTPAQIDRLGDTLMRQTKELERLRDEFGLKDEDLNLDLGPLGKLF